MKKQKRTGRLLTFVLIGMLSASLTACGKEKESEITDAVDALVEMDMTSLSLDVLANLDRETITEDGDYTNFNVTAEDGSTLRFQGINIEVTDEGISMGSGAILCSLDYMGKITDFKIDGNAPNCWIGFGPAYAESASVDNLRELFMGFNSFIEPDGEFEMDISSYETGFFALHAGGNAADIVLTQLMISYDSTAKQILYSELDKNSENAEIVAGYAPNWDMIGTMNPLRLAEVKMAEPGSITSDIIAGIDYESIMTKGDSTFFSSKMSDGEIIRFEGKNITISEEGILMCPDSEVTSLDAIGKIYQYTAEIKDADLYAFSGDEEGGQSYTNNMYIGYGYTYSAEKTSVDSAEEVHTYGYGALAPAEWNMGGCISVAYIEPNFIYFSGSGYNEEDFVLSGLSVGYNPAERVTGIRKACFNTDMTGAYLEGELYNQDIETLADEGNGTYSFYLILEPDTQYANMRDASRSICFVPNTFYRVGDLKDAEGNVLNKENAAVTAGTTLDVEVGDYTVSLELETQERYLGATTMNDLVPYAFLQALGENHTLVVPVVWADQTDRATKENLSLYRKALGRVEEADGSVTDYSDTGDKVFSLSEYFDMVSYGKYEVNSFLTDWCYIDRTFAENANAAPDKAYADEVLMWVKETYPDLDWSMFDKDGNGYVDSMIIINSGASQNADEYAIISYAGAIHYSESYYGDYAGTQESPNVNCYVNINQSFLENGNSSVLLHEFSHVFGIIDYYDVTYSGIDAVGGFDMQSENTGDWNAYSKLAVGWMKPQVVEGLSSGESVELTLQSMALTDDVIIIPAAGSNYEGVFSEYIMIDLLSDDGVNAYDAAQYGLQDTAGVRISHVDARMEKRTMEIQSKVNPEQTDVYDIGTIHYANAYTNDGRGFFNIEVIQSGKKNTFTDLNNEITRLTAADLFYAGDEFTVEEYEEFFYNGLMDDGKEFGYTVSIVNIEMNADGTPNATIKITAQ